MTSTTDPGAGLRLLATRIAAIPEALAALAAAPNPPLELGGTPCRVRTSGIGSSQAHARFLAARLEHDLGIAARFEPLSALAPSPPVARDDVLVLFSQGISPNVRPLLDRVADWRRLVLVTAASDCGSDPKSALLRRFAARGGLIRKVPAADEYGTLMRVIGPAVGYLEALRLVSAVARDPTIARVEVDALCARMRASNDLLSTSLAEGGLDSLDDLDDGIALLALGRYGELLHNLQCKVLEGMLLPLPPVWDLLEFAHGPFQQTFARRVTLFALVHHADPAERRLLDRLRGMLVADRHRLVVLASVLPGDLAIFEHEALLNALVLRYASERGIDPASWPGQGLDGALYESDDWAGPAPAPQARAHAREHRLERFTWPELERAVASGTTTAILGLGATEQHGPHLPFDTDSRIAEALADRLCAELGDAIRLPTIAIGCSPEHLAFPGTLSIEPETLTSMLEAVARSVRDAGCRRLFVFSAHGGNYETLRRALPRLVEAGQPLQVIAYLDLDDLTREMQRESTLHGISPEHGGHHAGEIETSILLAIDPSAVRRDACAPGIVEPLDDPQSIFYPSLRRHAPDGVVGDPTGADAARGARYLMRWVGLLAGAYRAEKNDP